MTTTTTTTKQQRKGDASLLPELVLALPTCLQLFANANMLSEFSNASNEAKADTSPPTSPLSTSLKTFLHLHYDIVSLKGASSEPMRLCRTISGGVGLECCRRRTGMRSVSVWYKSFGKSFRSVRILLGLPALHALPTCILIASLSNLSCMQRSLR